MRASSLCYLVRGGLDCDGWLTPPSCHSRVLLCYRNALFRSERDSECQKSGGAGSTAAAQSSRRTTAVVPACFVSRLWIANRLRRLCPLGTHSPTVPAGVIDNPYDAALSPQTSLRMHSPTAEGRLAPEMAESHEARSQAPA